ncbi:MAG: leucyl/phenylalanyl-tRNA--protein transferase [Bdellovibrionaceae bacterium]|nr:leucyl/phenylalanyl-tRNA--protein transferase [Pseudobdellovibrionaceae bacterium]NUM58939.1 leucyl/phenylalanyl-tRNA--protein transferase [Pseudobdellovibrionaceae bacterium]
MNFSSSLDFPDIPYEASYEDIVAIGGKLDVGTLYAAYSRGIFPWPQEGAPLLWFFPERRGVLDFKELHIPASLVKFIKKNSYRFEFTRNKAFPQVIEECQKQKRTNQPGTWIIPSLKKAYISFHQAGFVHSVECWENKVLVGGVYGVLINGVFSGESMFHKVSNSSKLSLLYLVEWLKQQNIQWMDTQMVTPVLESFGGKYISDKDYFKRLSR